MKILKHSFLLWAIVWMVTACNHSSNQTNTTVNLKTQSNMKDSIEMNNGFAEVNGMNMYYEVYGEGQPLILIHGGGSTIQSNFEKIITLFAKNRKVIAMELQAHGRSSDRDADLTFEQDADDVAALMQFLKIDNADVLGFSNGATTAIQFGIRHPQMLNKLIVCSPLTNRKGAPDWFWDFISKAHLDNMPEPLKQAYLKVAKDSNGLQVMHDRDAKRMVNFKDISNTLIQSIVQPTLIIVGDQDVVQPEHALELHRLIKHSQLAIIPGGHGEYIGEITTLKPDFKECELAVPMIEKFLNQSIN
jgi:pimeloyl-ACP methyl ester carboxylesterase